jgi:cytochrome P450
MWNVSLPNPPILQTHEIDFASDTISTTLASITFHLARNPQILRELQAELDTVDGVSTGAFEYRSISRLPYLEAVINETLRIQPPVQGGIYRVTPPDGLRFPDGTFIPGDTIISIPNLPIQRDARYFVDPEDFIPERWTSEPEKTINKAAFSPFSQGPYMCVGRGLAYIEMKTAIALLFSRFGVRLADGEDGRKFFEETKDCQVTHLGDFQIVFSKQ